MKYFPTSVATVVGDEWRKQKRIYNPVFNTNAYKTLFPKFLESVDLCCEKISQIKGETNAVPLFSAFTIDLLGNVIFDYDFGQLRGTDDKYYKAYSKIFNFDKDLLIYAGIVSFFPWAEKLPFFKKGRELCENVEILKELFAL